MRISRILFCTLCLFIFVGSNASAEEDDFDFDDLDSEIDSAVEYTPKRPDEPLPIIPKRGPSPTTVREKSRFIDHPNAAKGLIKITRDKTYIYKTEKSDQTKAASLRFGPFDPIELKNTDTDTSFNDNYDDTLNPMVLFDYEWQLWRSPIGKWGLNAGTGFYIANGNGRFANPAETRKPKEAFTFITLPFTGGATYRMQLWDKQPLIPYASGGGIIFTFTEIRDDGKSPKFGGALAAYAAAGIGINMSHLDTRSMLDLDREYGINGIFLTLEFRKIIGFTNYDFTSDVINGGMTFEF